MLLIYRMVKLTKYIDIRIFILSLAIGIFVVYMTTDTNRTIYIYPTPENVELMLYKDKANQCFAFEQKEVSCPRNPMNIEKIPIQA
jgi:hypothetical protein